MWRGCKSSFSGSQANCVEVAASDHVLVRDTKNESGVNVETGGDTFPGYYTMETLKAGKITGMICVNATTGTVWPHWWHADFVAKSE